jgi:hypothetical protein
VPELHLHDARTRFVHAIDDPQEVHAGFGLLNGAVANAVAPAFQDDLSLRAESSTPQRSQSALAIVVTYQLPLELPNSHVPSSRRLNSRVVDEPESLPPLPPAS